MAELRTINSPDRPSIVPGEDQNGRAARIWMRLGW